MLAADPGSFRDPENKVYVLSKATGSKGSHLEIYRGVNKALLSNFKSLSEQPFFNALIQNGSVIATQEVTTGKNVKAIQKDGWAGVLKHETVPFITYPYEWTFAMLKDAALLHLDIVEHALENGWTLKDATPYNVQWIKTRPVFIDIPSFEPWDEGTPWVGYRQFCSMFLTPLLLRAHLGIDHLPLLRAYLDGIPPIEAAKFFQGRKRWKKGVMSHLLLPAKVESKILQTERDAVDAKERAGRKHSKAMVVGLVQSLSRLVRKLTTEIEHTDWSHYDRTHSYDDAEHNEKKVFVEKHAKAKYRELIWDIGCNTGTFSNIAAPYADMVLSLDGDHDAVEQLYLKEKAKDGGNILPMVMNLANISPNQGWAGQERAALDKRKHPNLVLVLALIHHTRISANIPNILFLKWLRSLNAEVVIEFVTRQDEMVVKLLTNKKEQYPDYNLGQFVRECDSFFTIKDRQPLKGGKREIFFLTPKA